MSIIKKQKSICRGFTLIELLVVMAILGILAVIGLGSFRSAQIKGRDAKRKHDLSQIQKALEMFYNDNQGYPLTADFPTSGTTWQSAGTVYLKEIPSDPKFGSYQYSSDGVEYRLYARLENENDGCFDATTGPCSAGYDGYDGITCGTTTLFCNYQMTSPNIVLSP